MDSTDANAIFVLEGLQTLLDPQTEASNYPLSMVVRKPHCMAEAHMPLTSAFRNESHPLS